MKIFSRFRIDLQRAGKKLEIKSYTKQDGKTILLLLQLKPELSILLFHHHLSSVQTQGMILRHLAYDIGCP